MRTGRHDNTDGNRVFCDECAEVFREPAEAD
jgi:hypothetical protein